MRNRACQYVYGCRARATYGEPPAGDRGRPIFCAAHRQARVDSGSSVSPGRACNCIASLILFSLSILTTPSPL